MIVICQSCGDEFTVMDADEACPSCGHCMNCNSHGTGEYCITGCAYVRPIKRKARRRRAPTGPK